MSKVKGITEFRVNIQFIDVPKVYKMFSVQVAVED